MKLEKELKDENLEVRLIIWETKEIALCEGEKANIYIKSIFCAESLNDITIEKRTDIHNAS